jgi:hypothetical protein
MRYPSSISSIMTRSILLVIALFFCFCGCQEDDTEEAGSGAALFAKGSSWQSNLSFTSGKELTPTGDPLFDAYANRVMEKIGQVGTDGARVVYFFAFDNKAEQEVWRKEYGFDPRYYHLVWQTDNARFVSESAQWIIDRQKGVGGDLQKNKLRELKEEAHEHLKDIVTLGRPANADTYMLIYSGLTQPELEDYGGLWVAKATSLEPWRAWAHYLYALDCIHNEDLDTALTEFREGNVASDRRLLRCFPQDVVQTGIKEGKAAGNKAVSGAVLTGVPDEFLVRIIVQLVHDLDKAVTREEFRSRHDLLTAMHKFACSVASENSDETIIILSRGVVRRLASAVSSDTASPKLREATDLILEAEGRLNKYMEAQSQLNLKHLDMLSQSLHSGVNPENDPELLTKQLEATFDSYLEERALWESQAKPIFEAMLSFDYEDPASTLELKKLLSAQPDNAVKR